MFKNKNIKKNIQRDIISIKETIHSKVDSMKRGAVSWEEIVFLELKADDGKHLCSNLKDKDEHCIFDILSKFKM